MSAQTQKEQNMKQAILWTLINGGMLIALWFGLVDGVQGAQNIGILLVWVTIITSFFLLSDKVSDELVQKQGGMSVPVWLSWASDCAALALLAWHGWLWTAGIYLLAAMFQHGAISNAKERANKATEDGR